MMCLNPLHQDVHVLIPGTDRYVTLRGKRDSADVMETEDSPGLSGWAQCHPSVLGKGGTGAGSVTTEAEMGVMWP